MERCVASSVIRHVNQLQSRLKLYLLSAIYRVYNSIMKTEDKYLLHMLREKAKKACVVTRVAIGIRAG